MRVTTGRSVADIGVLIKAETAKGEAGAALITRPWRRPSLKAGLRALSGELKAQLDRVLLWCPVAFGLGAAAYLGFKYEPSQLACLVPVAFLVPMAALMWWRGGSRPLLAIIGLIAIAACGLLIAKVHSDRVASPIAPANLGEVTLEGWVADIATPSERGVRLLIAPVHIAGLTAAATPGRIRIVLAAPGGPQSAPPPGTAIRVTTLLDPPPGPAAPGTYDFAREAWFEGIGGVGITMRRPEPVELPTPPWRLRLEMQVNALRWWVAGHLAEDIHRVMGDQDGGAAGLAAAVTTSHQDWLEPAHREDLRGSGLAHMLAIAGLHTAAVSGAAFFAFRLGIAAWPWLAVRVNGKKLAALAALVVVGAYLVLSGAHPPARRAAITASVAFFAILMDRRAISLHSLAVAALIILIIEPEVVLSPGFEMSFCATASLVALAEIWHRPTSAFGLSGPIRWLQRLRDGLIALSLVSLVAGAATGPFTIQHFNRVSNYGVFANLTADFLASAVLMPSLALCLAAEFVGLPHVVAAPLYVLAGWAAKGVIFLGHVFSVAPGSNLAYTSAPQIALVLSYIGIVFACLWKGHLRWLGVPMAFAVALWPRPEPPVAWIAADGNDAAIVVAGEVVGLKPLARAYATGLWAQKHGFAIPIDPGGVQGEHFSCNRLSCVPIGSVRPAIAAWWTKRKPSLERLTQLCSGADFLILRAEVTAPAACDHVLVLYRANFTAGGAAEIFATPTGWHLDWSQPIRGDRPWSRAAMF